MKTFALPFRRLTEQAEIVAFLDSETRQVRHPHRRSPARHRPAARTPHRPDLRRRHRQDRRARASSKRRPHEPAQGDQLRDRDLRAPRRQRLAVRRRRRGEATTGRGRCSRRTCWPGCRPPSRRRGKRSPRTTARRPPKRCWPACATQLDQRGTLDVLRHGIELLGLQQHADAGAVQAGAGHEPRHPRPLRRQPPAGRAAGALFAAQRELHRPRAVPERHAGGDGRTEDRLHPEHRRRDRPVSLRPPSRGPRAKPPSRCCPSPAGRWSISPSATAKST